MKTLDALAKVLHRQKVLHAGHIFLINGLQLDVVFQPYEEKTSKNADKIWQAEIFILFSIWKKFKKFTKKKKKNPLKNSALMKIVICGQYEDVVLHK